jgi:hypothetical protein
MKLTPWFPAHVKPVYPGVYEIQSDSINWYRRWDGNRWFVGATTKESAAVETIPFFGTPDAPWRGLAEPPKGWKK